MHSAKTLRVRRQDWVGRPTGVTIFVVGWESNPGEPLLLEALASHPACEKLYFIPLDGPAGKLNFSAMREDFDAHKTKHGDNNAAQLSYPDRKNDIEQCELLAYDVKGLLNRGDNPGRTTDEIDVLLQAHFKKRELVPVTTSEANIYINAHGHYHVDGFSARRNWRSLHVNNPHSLYTNYKGALPFINEEIFKASGVKVTPPCAYVDGPSKVRAFMDEHGYDQIVMKEGDNACGNGVFRVFRASVDGPLMVEKPSTKSEVDGEHRVFALTDKHVNPKNPMLVMEWLDNSKGDIRAVLINGKCAGAYIRHNSGNTWLCNYAQGGTIRPIDLKRDLSARDRQKIHQVAKKLSQLGILQASIDLLADEKGERFLSEINIGNTDDLVEISKHWGDRDAKYGRLPIADRVAENLIAAYDAHALRLLQEFERKNPALIAEMVARFKQEAEPPAR